ncbi:MULTISPECIES: polysaccharide pyruvyl transferase family protein [Comamonas]|uniref:polysaccharide pyruvyl transferase family protein n=1 Tax=Comamonas TaxID=283 RepID=UPI0009BA77B7|nr:MULTISPECIES: polysaccharide pyruvyl transferase family protein [Comamonas]MDN5536196.1 polysaccharide pyruvyl transferase family protein [Comamonas sp.]
MSTDFVVNKGNRYLFYLYPALLSQGPHFNLGWSLLLLRIMRGLVATGFSDCHMITASRFKDLLGSDLEGLSISYIDELDLHQNVTRIDAKSSIPTELSRLVRNTPYEKPSVVGLLKKKIVKACCDFSPNVVITFAMQADYIKSLWPDAHVFYVETGAFSRSPYPMTLFFDHQGMYGQSIAAQLQEDAIDVDDSARALAKDIRAHETQMLKETDPFATFDFREKFDRLVLLPLQVSNYFSFDDQAPYRTQFEFLLEVLSRAPKDVGIIVTEYIQWGEVLHSEGAWQNLEWLSKTFPNLIFKEEFRKILSPSQYLANHVDGLLTICSNLGYQALLLEKRLGCVYESFLKNVAHDQDIKKFFDNLKKKDPPADRLNFLAWYIERYAVPESLFNDGKWFSNYIERRIKAIESATKPEDGFVPIASPDVLRKLWLNSASKETQGKWESEHAHLIRRMASADCENAILDGAIAAQRPYPPARSPSLGGKYILLNETRRIEGGLHLGCNAVTRFIEERMAFAGLSCLGFANFSEECDALLRSPGIEYVKLVVLNGEGSLHHDNGRIRDLMLFCRAMKERAIPCVLINTTWHENTAVLGELLETFDIVTVRDSISMQEIKPWRSDVRVVPDISFAAFSTPEGIFTSAQDLPVVRSSLAVIDHVKKDIASNLAAFAEFHRLPFYLMGPPHINALIQQAGSAFQVNKTIYPRILRSPQALQLADTCITGRFHGLTAAMCAGVPVVAVSSNTPKIEGLLDDIGIREDVLLPDKWLELGRNRQRDSAERKLSGWNDDTHQLVVNFAESARGKISQLFDDIETLISNAEEGCNFSPAIRQRITPVLVGENRVLDVNQFAFTAYLAEGFHQPEQWGVWSNGKCAKLVFPVDLENASEVEITITMVVKVFEGVIEHGPVLQVVMSDSVVGYVLFRPSSKNQQEISFTRRIGKSSCQIELTVSHAVSPHFLKKSDDGRELGFGLCGLSINVSPIKEYDLNTPDAADAPRFWGISEHEDDPDKTQHAYLGKA